MDSTLARFFLALLSALSLPAAAVNHDTVVPPIPPGRFVVACSNIEQDVSRMLPGGVPADYWEGRQVQGRDTYISDLLVHPASAVTFNASVPDVRRLYPGHAGETVPFVAIVCHPTSRTNTDASYTLPGGTGAVPRMLPAGAAPRLISTLEWMQTLGLDPSPLPPPGPAKLPMIVYSHGLGGSPIGKGYIDILVQLASQGYVVAAPFHADARFSRLRVEDLSDVSYLLFNFERIAEMQLMRPLGLKSMTDALLAHPGFAPAIDADRIGGFGASLGGQAMAHLLGARMTTSFDQDCNETVRDPRIKAAVGYVPYSGQPYLPAFCSGQSGAADVNRPYLAIAGTADTTAPSRMTEQAVNRMGSSRYFVELVGGEHELRTEDAGDLFTWMITFLDAYLDVRPSAFAARQRLIKMRGVTGGRQDNLLVDVHVPSQLFEGEVLAREFHNTRLEHYFVAAGQDEIVSILTGGAGPGWELTREGFKVYPRLPADTFTAVGPVCRFYGPGPNSHFFTASASECELVKRDRGWLYEGTAFHIRTVQSDGRCPAGYLEVNRAYNNGFPRNDSNHRFSTSDSTMREMQRRGWTVEGTVMCATF